MERGVPFLNMINNVIDDPQLSQTEKVQKCYILVNELWADVKRRLNYEPERMRATYNKLREHGLI
jgi:hypothetical protein